MRFHAVASRPEGPAAPSIINTVLRINCPSITPNMTGCGQSNNAVHVRAGIVACYVHVCKNLRRKKFELDHVRLQVLTDCLSDVYNKYTDIPFVQSK